MLLVAGFAVSATLLWLSAQTGSAAVSQPAPIGLWLLTVAVVLGACGLWWPSQALRGGSQDAMQSLWPWLPALALAGLSSAVARLWQRRQRPWAVGVAVALPIAAYVYAMFSAPGVFRAGSAPDWLGVGTLTLGLAAALVATHLDLGRARYAKVVRVGGALAVATLASAGAGISLPAVDAAGGVFSPQWLVVLGLIAVGALLLAMANAGRSGAPTAPARASRNAAVDNLTGLPTRLYFEGQLHREAKKCDARSTRLALLFIDLDGFKPVNDTFGHNSGDRVLEQVGQRLKEFARGTGLTARIGGDEFLLLATGITSSASVAKLAQRLIETLSQPYKFDDREVGISCSIGIALYPQKCESSKLIARADAAMYASKRAGGSRHSFYTPEMDADVQQNFDLLRDLRQALAKGELELFYQPKIDARSGKVTATEALLRWNHPTRGMVMPGEFLPLAERSGLIGPLGNWVIEAACQQARAWRDKGLRMRVAINLSAHQMRQDDIADRITDALTRHRIHPSLLTCEITESAAMEDTGATQETFRRLGELGAHLSIDDFGTGYSSLSYLRRLPAEELKIDRSFVNDLDNSADARAVVDAVVKLAHALGLKVVAEGVETPRQQKILTELGCDELQGFLFAKPMSARALLLWAMDDRSESAAFRDSLFGETRQVSRQGLRPVASPTARPLAARPPSSRPAASRQGVRSGLRQVG
ncbi:MAG: EAL domain-containing protein [Burkholderiaceae bacterium]